MFGTCWGDHLDWGRQRRDVGSSKKRLLDLARFLLVASFESSNGCDGRGKASNTTERASSVVEASSSLAFVGGATVLLLEHDSEVAVVTFSAEPGVAVLLILVTFFSPDVEQSMELTIKVTLVRKDINLPFALIWEIALVIEPTVITQTISADAIPTLLVYGDGFPPSRRHFLSVPFFVNSCALITVPINFIAVIFKIVPLLMANRGSTVLGDDLRLIPGCAVVWVVAAELHAIVGGSLGFPHDNCSGKSCWPLIAKGVL